MTNEEIKALLMKPLNTCLFMKDYGESTLTGYIPGARQSRLSK